jgi:hypothetical protein
MPDGTNNIYVDLTFTTTADDQQDIDAELTLADADVIGAYNMPVIYTTTASTPAFQLANVEYSTGTGTTSGTIERDVEYYISASVSGVFTSLVDYSVGAVISGSSDKYVDCFLAGDTGISGVPGTTLAAQNTLIDYIVGQVFDALDINIQTIYWNWPAYFGTASFPAQYTHLPGIDTSINRTVYISLGSIATMTSGTQTGYVDVEFAGWVNYPLDFDLYCALEKTDEHIDSELTVISGSVAFHLTDIMCAVSGTQDFSIDIYCCLETFSNLDSELTVISGSADKLDYDLYCSGQSTDHVSFDVDLFSLKISNFSIDEEEYVFVSDGVSVDITDDIYAVLTSASGIPCSGTCCLKVDDEVVPVTFSGITDGYRMFYNPIDSFSSLEGSTAFTVHAENSNGDILERDYYLTYGYLMDYDNINRIGFDYGINTQVIVRMSAENLATCPKDSAGAYWFETRDYSQKGLSASIVGELPDIISDETGLGASISPQSTAFFYGKTFRVVLNVRDFAGNIMEPYEFEFKIEDAPE